MSILKIILGEHAKSVETIVYKKVNGVDIHGDVYLPKRSLPGLPPCVYFVHGGGFMMGDRVSFIPPYEIREMLLREWAVVSIDYRLSPNAAMKDLYEDVADGYSWIRRELNNQVDVNRIVVWGHSAGGTLTEAAGYILYPRPKVLVSFYGLSDFLIDYNPDPSIPTPEYSALAEQIRTGHTISPDTWPDPNIMKVNTQDPVPLLLQDAHQVKKVAEILMHSKEINVIRRYSPINNVGLDYPPIYLVHGNGDNIVACQHSETFAKVVKEKGIPCELKVVEGGPHGFDFLARPKIEDENWEKYIRPAYDFVNNYL